MNNLTQLARKYRELLLYGVIGGASAALDIGIFSLLVEVFNIAWQAAQTVSVGVAMVFSFLINSHYNFRKTDAMHRRFALFVLASLFGYGVGYGVIQVLHESMGYNESIAKLASLPFVFVVQFAINKLITFSDHVSKK